MREDDSGSHKISTRDGIDLKICMQTKFERRKQNLTSESEFDEKLSQFQALFAKKKEFLENRGTKLKICIQTNFGVANTIISKDLEVFEN